MLLLKPIFELTRKPIKENQELKIKKKKKKDDLGTILLDSCTLQMWVVRLCEFCCCTALRYFICHNYSANIQRERALITVAA